MAGEEPVRHFWARTDPPPERLILWRGKWEAEYVRTDVLRELVAAWDAWQEQPPEGDDEPTYAAVCDVLERVRAAGGQ